MGWTINGDYALPAMRKTDLYRFGGMRIRRGVLDDEE